MHIYIYSHQILAVVLLIAKISGRYTLLIATTEGFALMIIIFIHRVKNRRQR